MHMIRRAAGFSALLMLFTTIFLAAGADAETLRVNAQGRIQPFKLKNMKLSDFVREYARISGKRIQTEGPWESSLPGNVTLFVPRPVSMDKFTEIFHQVLIDNSFTVIDAPMNSGWIVLRVRDARDLSLPVYTEANLPDTRRLVTVMYSLKHTHAEEIARTFRSFMPPSSRIIPITRSQLAITDTGRNIHPKLSDLLRQLDTEEAAKLIETDRAVRENRNSCKPKEQKIERLTVEKLEIADIESIDPKRGKK